jgi:RNA polymerase sigma-54 factor
MALSPKLELRQSQSLVMTPQLMQAIKLLQLSNLDLVAFVEPSSSAIRCSSAADAGEGGGERCRAGAATTPTREAARADRERRAGMARTSLEGGAAIEARARYRPRQRLPDDHGRAASETAPALPAESWSAVAAAARGQLRRRQSRGLRRRLTEKSLADHLSDQLGVAVSIPRCA